MLEGADILGIFPIPSISHQVVYHTLMKDLAARGHHLTILTTDMMKTDNPNVTQIVFREAYDLFNEFSYTKFKKDQRGAADFPNAILPVFYKIMDQQLSHPAVKRLIDKKDSRKFDVLIVEMIYFTPMLLFGELYDCPVIGISSLDASSTIYSMYGNDINPVVHPDFILPYIHNQLTFTERWKSLKYQLNIFNIYRNAMRIHTQALQHFPISEFDLKKFVEKRLHLLFVNTNPILGNIRPLLPNTIQLGFMHIEPPKPLQNGALKSFMDNSKNGVIYMSLGSNIKSNELNADIITIFVDVFSKLDYDIVWKFESKDLPHKPDNVMISKWLPQSDVLAHPAVKLFITQGGQQSIEEAIDRTIPMLVIPFLIDQNLNAKKIVEKGIGCQMELHSLSEDKLSETINEMLSPRYKQNIEKLKDLIFDQPMTSREKAVWWTEYVIRHNGADHLKYPGRFVPFYQKYCLDFIGIGVVSITFMLKMVFILIRKFKHFGKRKSE